METNLTFHVTPGQVGKERQLNMRTTTVKTSGRTTVKTTVKTNGITSGRTSGRTTVKTNGITNGITSGRTTVKTNGITNGITNGTSNGITNGTSTGITNGTSTGITVGKRKIIGVIGVETLVVRIGREREDARDQQIDRAVTLRKRIIQQVPEIHNSSKTLLLLL
jgi:hypothetical protein